MSILSSDSHCVSVFVVFFVDPVKLWAMKGSVPNVKEEVFHEQDENKLPDDGFSVRDFLHGPLVVTCPGIVHSQNATEDDSIESDSFECFL
jgi:hypothetical protein